MHVTLHLPAILLNYFNEINQTFVFYCISGKCHGWVLNPVRAGTQVCTGRNCLHFARCRRRGRYQRTQAKSSIEVIDAREVIVACSLNPTDTVGQTLGLTRCPVRRARRTGH